MIRSQHEVGLTFSSRSSVCSQSEVHMRPFFQNGTFTLTLVRDFYVLIDKTIGAGPSNPLRDTELTLARAHALPPMMSGFLHSIRPPAHIRRTKASGGQKS